MDKLYIATMMKKKKLEGGEMYIYSYCGIIVGLLFGTTFLSSRSKKYKPMLSNTFSNSDGVTIITNEYNKENISLIKSDNKYSYYNLIEVKDYDKIEEMIDNLKEKYKDVSYFINLDGDIPYILRYKNKKNNN